MTLQTRCASVSGASRSWTSRPTKLKDSFRLRFLKDPSKPEISKQCTQILSLCISFFFSMFPSSEWLGTVQTAKRIHWFFGRGYSALGSAFSTESSMRTCHCFQPNSSSLLGNFQVRVLARKGPFAGLEAIGRSSLAKVQKQPRPATAACFASEKA